MFNVSVLNAVGGSHTFPVNFSNSAFVSMEQSVLT